MSRRTQFARRRQFASAARRIDAAQFEYFAAFREGHKACKADAELEANPYSPTRQKRRHQGWAQGWQWAADELRDALARAKERSCPSELPEPSARRM